MQNHTGTYFIIRKTPFILNTRIAIYLIIPNYLYLIGNLSSFRDWLSTGEEFAVFVKR